MQSRRIILTSLADLTAEQVIRIAQLRDREMVLDIFSQIRKVSAVPLKLHADRAKPLFSLIEALAHLSPWLQGQALRATFLKQDEGRKTMFELCACITPTNTRNISRTPLDIPFTHIEATITRMEGTEHPDITVFVTPWKDDRLSGYRVLFRKRASAPVQSSLPSARPKPRIDTLRPQSLSVPPPPPTQASSGEKKPPPMEELTDEDLVEDLGEPYDDPIPLVRRTESRTEGGPTFSRVFV